MPRIALSNKRDPNYPPQLSAQCLRTIISHAPPANTTVSERRQAISALQNLFALTAKRIQSIWKQSAQQSVQQSVQRPRADMSIQRPRADMSIQDKESLMVGQMRQFGLSARDIRAAWGQTEFLSPSYASSSASSSNFPDATNALVTTNAFDTVFATISNIDATNAFFDTISNIEATNAFFDTIFNTDDADAAILDTDAAILDTDAAILDTDTTYAAAFVATTAAAEEVARAVMEGARAEIALSFPTVHDETNCLPSLPEDLWSLGPLDYGFFGNR